MATAKSKARPATKAAAKPTSSNAAALVKSSSAKVESNRRIGEEALALVRRRWVAIAEAFYDIGVAFRTLARPAVYGALGYRSFDELLSKRELGGRTAAYELIRIAESFTREEAVALGQEKANALIQYVGATRKSDTPQEILRRGTIEGQPVLEVTATEVEKMARRRKSPARASAPAGDGDAKAAEKKARALQAWLRKRGARTVTAKLVSCSSGWKVEVTFALAEVDAIVGG